AADSTRPAGSAPAPARLQIDAGPTAETGRNSARPLPSAAAAAPGRRYPRRLQTTPTPPPRFSSKKPALPGPTAPVRSAVLRRPLKLQSVCRIQLHGAGLPWHTYMAMQVPFKKRSGAAAPAVRNLTALKRGESAILDRIDLPEEDARRLMELGFLPG